jgi:hypothetical protein
VNITVKEVDKVFMCYHHDAEFDIYILYLYPLRVWLISVILEWQKQNKIAFMQKLRTNSIWIIHVTV